MWTSWSKGGFAEAGDHYSPFGALPGGFQAKIVVEGSSFVLSHIFLSRTNHKTMYYNLFVVLPALDQIILIPYTFVP